MLSTLVRKHDNGFHKIMESNVLRFWTMYAPGATVGEAPAFDLLLLLLYLTLHGNDTAPGVPSGSRDTSWTFEVVGHFTHLVCRAHGSVWRFAVYTPTAKSFTLFNVSMRIDDVLKTVDLAGVVLVSGASLNATGVDVDIPSLIFDGRMFATKLDALRDDAATATAIATTMATILAALPAGFKACTFVRTGAHVGKGIVCSPFARDFEDALKPVGGEGTVVVQGDGHATKIESASKKRKLTDDDTAAKTNDELVKIMSQQLQDLLAETKELRNDNKELRNDNKELRSDNKELRDQTKPVPDDGQLKALVADNEQLRSQVTTLAATHEVLSKQFKTLSDDMEQVRGQLKALGGAPPLHPKTPTSSRPSSSSGASSTSSTSSGLLSSGQLSSSSSSSGASSSSSGASARDSESRNPSPAPESRNPSPAPVCSKTLVWNSALQSFRSPVAVPATIAVDNWIPTPQSSSSSSSYASSTMSATQPTAESPVRPMGNMLHVSPDGPSPPTLVSATTHITPAVQPTAARMLQVDDNEEEMKNEAML
ncbi:hypothetical protein SDRG_08672 [Saprolegnia diclina VS20]|uniref:Uncharacterized protein n=1 Tax=Saprolegnia diclina (strain VS20) TaxID=1156394 RepID=T0RNQ7_SAPDV|nr:hypothetical protein SDRG_08672 [Saprolegnia diclina VS20]EQC33993.1 hypothetical protein SDRG_08672 [Saprolegnia diclina VS20]|eukprot:XP_008612788.1 hypothetical protein SDRG_08672 [Saprolegnia diclina VS20]